MGVDKQGIRTVIHLEAPSSIEAYLQESGRGGRDRNPAKAILITSTLDREGPIIDIIRSQCCRREGYLKLLGADLEFCSGCDICDGTYKDLEVGVVQIILFLIKNKKCFTIDECSRILKGFFTYNGMNNQHHNTCGFGLLKLWDLDSIKDAISLLINRGDIKISKNPLTKGVLSINNLHLHKKFKNLIRNPW